MRAVSSLTAGTIRRFLPLAESIAITALGVFFIAKGLVPGWQSLHSDFGNYYTVARLLCEHYSLDRIYDWIWLQRVKDHWSIQQPFAAFVGLTPFSALPMVPLAWLSALDAKRVWLGLNLGILAASLHGMQGIAGIGFRRVALVALFAIIPLRNNFLLGQMHVVVLGLLVLAHLLYERKRWLGCSMALGVAASLKIYPLFFVFYFLRKREWKPAAVLAGSTLGLLALCLPIFGTPVMRVFLIEQLPRMLRGEVTDPFSLTAPSASSFFHRAFLMQPQTNPHPLFASTLLFALLYPLWQLSLFAATLLLISSKEVDPRRSNLEWASWTCLLLALSTEPASYHRVALIFVAVLGVYAIASAWLKAIFLACCFVACNIHPSVSAHPHYGALAVAFLPFLALVAALFCLLVALRSRQSAALASITVQPGRRRLQIGVALAGFAAIWGAVSAMTFAHARTLNGPAYWMDRNGSGAYAQFAPHLAGKHLLTVAMLPQGYRVEDEEGGQYPTGPAGNDDDQLSIASSPHCERLWIEVSNQGQSRLVEIPVRSGDKAPTPIATILDGESPALSLDGKSLAFLRERKGAGGAWIVRLDEKGQMLTAPVMATPAGMDARGIEFTAQGEVMVSSAEEGFIHLFVLRDGSSPQRVFSDYSSMGLPAAHTDGPLLVYPRQRNGFWQLFASDPSREGAMQLTFGDCNAHDPAWLDESRLAYISDCGRGMGMGALAEIDIGRVAPVLKDRAAWAAPSGQAQGESKE